MRTLVHEWLAAEGRVAEAEDRFRGELLQYRAGERSHPPPVADILRARVLRAQTRDMLQRVIATVRSHQ